MLSYIVARRHGIALLHVPYKGFAPSANVVVAGDVHLTWAGALAARGHVASSRLRAIGFAAARRSP